MFNRVLVIIALILFLGCEQNRMGTVIEDAVIYTDEGKPYSYAIYKGSKVMSVAGRCDKGSKDNEPMSKIMMPNKHGDFVDDDNYRVCMPSRKIKWD